MLEKQREQMRKREVELGRKTKAQLWELRNRHYRIADRDAGYLKCWLIGDVMRLEFGRLVDEFYSN